MKRKTPHQRTGEALIFTLGTPTTSVGGRTTSRCDNVTLQFANYENIQEIIENIIVFYAIISISVLKSLRLLHLSAAFGQNGKSVLTSGKKFSKV